MDNYRYLVPEEREARPLCGRLITFAIIFGGCVGIGLFAVILIWGGNS